ncbi:MAG: hypothetical protein U0441_33210 [Polyangiaceae bacterium]
MPAPWLNQQRLQEVHAAAIRAQIPHAAGLRAEFTATLALPGDASESARLLASLQAMNDIDVLADGSVPMRDWLHAAISLAGPREEGVTFTGALESMGFPVTPPASKRSPVPPKERGAARRTWLLLGGLAGVTLVGIGLYFAYVRWWRHHLKLEAKQYTCMVEDTPLRKCRIEASSSSPKVLRLVFEPATTGSIIYRYSGDLEGCPGRGDSTCRSVQLLRYYEDGDDVDNAPGGSLTLDEQGPEWRGTWTIGERQRTFTLRSPAP